MKVVHALLCTLYVFPSFIFNILVERREKKCGKTTHEISFLCMCVCVCVCVCLSVCVCVCVCVCFIKNCERFFQEQSINLVINEVGLYSCPVYLPAHCLISLHRSTWRIAKRSGVCSPAWRWGCLSTTIWNGGWTFRLEVLSLCTHLPPLQHPQLLDVFRHFFRWKAEESGRMSDADVEELFAHLETTAII